MKGSLDFEVFQQQIVLNRGCQTCCELTILLAYVIWTLTDFAQDGLIQ